MWVPRPDLVSQNHGNMSCFYHKTHNSLNNLSQYLLHYTGRFDPKKRRLLTTLNREFKLDNTRMRKVLGVIPRSTATTLIDMGYSMIDKGVVKKMPNYGSRDTGEHHLYKKRGRVTRWMRHREDSIISVVM